ncbi:hypothetical protein CspHIS471_0410350 [Cutaneotrichosporon sp. HIS471]|nr:hypothetical protein CspHIS471_0410350 [Cutaneotrichosporon sp. HIS471]
MPIPNESALFAPLSRPIPTTITTFTKLEPLCFDKVPLSPLSPTYRSASMSTDCESTFSDSADLSRSPSLLTSLIQTQTRRSARTTPATTPGVSPTATPAPLPLTSRPILRRCSSGAFSDAVIEESNQGLPRRRSCLKFAVTPRPLQLSNRSSVSAASSRRASGASSRLTSPRCATPALDEDDEEDDLATTAFDTDDAGYQEDSEDGFTSDEDGPPLVPLAQWPATWTKQGVTPAPAPILWTAARRAADVAEPSTDDCDEVVPRRSRVRVRYEDPKDSIRRGRCSTHRSPPPDSHVPEVEAEVSAPPAAHSPSAADLCRRRTGVTAARGWRSDDCARRAPRGVTFIPNRKTSQASVQFTVNQRTCSVVVRRDSAPAAGVEEVHVLADPSATPCPLAKLRALTS